MKRVIVAVVIGVSSSVAHAQVVTVGAYGGVNRAKADGAEPTSSPVGGLSLGIGLGGSFALGFAVEYSGRGASIVRQSGADPGAMVDYELGYLAAPIGMRLELGRGAVPIHVSVGTTIGALLFATQTEAGMESDVRSELRPIDVTADLGGGIGYRLSPRVALTADVRWSLALIDGARPDAALDVDSWKGRTLQLLVGMTFTLNPAPSAPSFPGMPPMQ